MPAQLRMAPTAYFIVPKRRHEGCIAFIPSFSAGTDSRSEQKNKTGRLDEKSRPVVFFKRKDQKWNANDKTALCRVDWVSKSPVLS